jgi:hypothetical protein
MNQNNFTKTLRIFSTYSEVFSVLNALSEAFRKHYRKNSETDLVYSQSGDPKHPVHALAVWHDGSDKQAREIEYYAEALNKL